MLIRVREANPVNGLITVGISIAQRIWGKKANYFDLKCADGEAED